jgi:signal transduction histidine kinase
MIVNIVLNPLELPHFQATRYAPKKWAVKGVFVVHPYTDRMRFALPTRSAILQAVALTALFAGLNYLGTALYWRAETFTTVKPFSGVALALMLIGGRRAVWPVLISGYAGGVIAKLPFSYGLADGVFTPLWASGSIYVTWLIARRILTPGEEFRAWKELVGFTAAATVTSAASALGVGLSRVVFNGSSFLSNLAGWWGPTTLSFVIFTPLIVLIATSGPRALRENGDRVVASLVLMMVALGVTFLPTGYPLSFIVPLALLIVTMVAEIEGAAMALMLTQIGYVTAITFGLAPSAVNGMTLGQQLQFSQIFLCVLNMVLLPAAAAVTERRKLRDRQGEIVAALRESERRYRDLAEREQSASKAKSEFLAGMSHELRTPLNAILGFSEVIKGEMYGPLGNEKYREYAEDVYKSGAHLLDLINDVLDLSKIDAGKMELRESLFQPPALVDECLSLLRDKARGRVELGVTLEPGLPQLRADKRLVKQILLNLLSNAVKFTPEGGRVSVIALRAPDGGLNIHVEDTGIGMSEEEVRTAFSVYGQVDSKIARTHQGTGLGLPISRSLAELHGGTLSARSVKGTGTRMTLYLPEGRMVIETAPLAASA